MRGYQVITARRVRVKGAPPLSIRPMDFDLGLPDMSGIDVLAWLRGWLTAPVIALSARTDSSDKVQALDGRRRLRDETLNGRLARLRAAVRRKTAAADWSSR